MRRIVLLVLVGLASLASVQAQDLKIGYANTDSIAVKHPDYKVAQKSLETYAKQLQNQLKIEQEKAQKRYAELQQKAATMTPEELSAAEQELLELQNKLQKQSVAAQANLAKREQDLLKPIFEKIQNAIKTVAKEKGYTYILSDQLLIYKTEVDDITQLVIDQVK